MNLTFYRKFLAWVAVIVHACHPLAAQNGPSYCAVESFHIALCRAFWRDGCIVEFRGPLANGRAYRYLNSTWAISWESQSGEMILEITNEMAADAVEIDTGCGTLWLRIDGSKSPNELKKFTSDNFRLFHERLRKELIYVEKYRNWSTPVPKG